MAGSANRSLIPAGAEAVASVQFYRGGHGGGAEFAEEQRLKVGKKTFRFADKARVLLSALRASSAAKPFERSPLRRPPLLAPALALYRSFGFRELTGMKRRPRDYARVDVWMELAL